MQFIIACPSFRAYYSPNGLDYNLGRTNMGGCDFSVRPYTYLDTVGDTSLSTFQLQEEDLVYKVRAFLCATFCLGITDHLL